MSFWSVGGEEPLRQNRWYIVFGEYGKSEEYNLDDYTYALKECTKPSYDIDIHEYRLITQQIKIPGNLKWKPIDIKFVSANNKKKYLPEALHKYIISLGYNPPGQNQSIKKPCGSINLIQIDSSGNQLETWEIKNPIITNINYGSLSYENEGFVDVSFTIHYDWAQLVYNEDVKVFINPGFPRG